MAECVIHNEDFLKEIGAHKQFDYTKLKSSEVEAKLREYTPVVLTTYYSKYSKFGGKSKTIAYRNTGSNVVYFNTYKNPRAMAEMINTAVHEWSHVKGFDHGDNRAAGKGNSLPYGGGKIAEKYVDRCLVSTK